MAPEQLEGKPADHRTDLFAFGAVVYEMMTGRRAFKGDDPASVIGAILKDEPTPLSSLQPLVSAALERVLRRCLAKDPDERWQSAKDRSSRERGLPVGHHACRQPTRTWPPGVQAPCRCPATRNGSWR
ncbi:MAG: protein kinase domain-containing protein [Burkholderiales bacterium]